MKKVLTLFLISLSLSGFSQTMKGDWVITPKCEIGYSNDINIYVNQNGSVFNRGGSKQYRYRFSTSADYFLNEHLAVGGLLGVNMDYGFPESNFRFNNNTLSYEIGGHLRYNVLESRFSPFLETFFGYNYRRYFVDNVSMPPSLREWYKSGYSFGTSAGIGYFITPRFGGQLSLNYSKYDYDLFYGDNKYPFTIGFGCSFIINNP